MAAYDKKSDEIVFNNGRRLYGVQGIIGIGHNLMPHYGFDGDVYEAATMRDGADLTNAEWLELADLMLSYWTQFKAVVSMTTSYEEQSPQNIDQVAAE